MASGIVRGTNLKQNGRDYGRTFMKVQTHIKNVVVINNWKTESFLNKVKGHLLNKRKHIKYQLLRPI